jgi:diacylglycerol kinase (ATP)
MRLPGLQSVRAFILDQQGFLCYLFVIGRFPNRGQERKNMAHLRLAFLVNPFSGAGQGEKVARILIRMLPEHPVMGGQSAVFMVNEISPEKLREIVSGSELVFVVGGDGTVSRLIGHIIEAQAAPILGLIPIGTSNDLARALGGRLDANYEKQDVLLKTVERLVSARPVDLDVFQINDSLFFTNYFSIGFDAVIVSDFEKTRNRRWFRLFPKATVVNNIAYFMLGLKNVGFHLVPPVTITIEYEGREQRLIFENTLRAVIATNLPVYAGGTRINPEGQFDDGIFELTVIESLYQYVVIIATRFIPFLRLPRSIRQYRAERAQIHIQAPASCQIDGEHRSDDQLLRSKLEIAYSGRIRILV